MGSAMVDPLRDSHELTVASPNSKPKYPCKYVTCVSQLVDCDPFSIIMVGCKPWQAEEVLTKLPANCYTKDTILVSIMAGHDEESLKKMVKGEIKIARVMPNLGVQVGKGITVALWEGPGLEFLEKLGVVIYTKDPQEFSTISLVSGCGTGYVHQMMNAFEKSWRKLGSFTIIQLMIIQKLTSKT